MAIRELLTWEDPDGETRSLTIRYHKASAHLVNAASDFGRRQEPRLLLECARRFIGLDHEDRLTDAGGSAAPQTAPELEPPPPAIAEGGVASGPPADDVAGASCACTRTWTTTC